MKKFSIFIIATLVALVSCSKDKVSADMDKINGTFILHSFDGEAIMVPQDKQFPTLKFDDSTKQVSGFAGCNNVSGSYSTDAGELKFINLVATKKACFNDEYEAKILKALNDANDYEISEDLLILKQGNENILFLKKLNLD